MSTSIYLSIYLSISICLSRSFSLPSLAFCISRARPLSIYFSIYLSRSISTSIYI